MSQPAGPIVKIKQGKVRGFVENNGICEFFAFRGIPFAEPPIGELRFKDPKAPRPWTGVRDVGDVYTKAPQFDFMTRRFGGDEDCLYLQVATKSLEGKKAVMVWIHGGGFVQGVPNKDFCGPDFLVKHDIVFVAIAYRLGCLGFLNLDLPEASGNQGLKDQVAALKWVKENIHAFGGDPNNITIFGESAGSASVHYLTVSPLAKGLFNKAIAQSGVFLNPWAFDPDPKTQGLRLVKTMGKNFDHPKDALRYLMKAPVKELIEAQNNMNPESDPMELIFDFVPSMDGNSVNPFLPEHPEILAKRGIDVPLIFGYTSEEGIIVAISSNLENIFSDINDDFPKWLSKNLKIDDIERVRKIADSVKKHYFPSDTITARNIEHRNQFVKIAGDLQFINGIQKIADVQMKESSPTYFYRFSYRATYPTIRSLIKSDLEGTCHADELGALFLPMALLANVSTYAKNDRLVSERMTRMWTNFAKTGNPTPEVDDVITCEWKPLTKDAKHCLEINDDLAATINRDSAVWDWWKSILATM